MSIPAALWIALRRAVSDLPLHRGRQLRTTFFMLLSPNTERLIMPAMGVFGGVVGNVFVRTCENCHTSNWWVYKRVWDLLNYIPVNQRHFVLCPICGHGFKIQSPYVRWVRSGGKDEVGPTKELVRLTRDYYERRTIDAEQYRSAIQSNPVWQRYADHPPEGDGGDVGQLEKGE